MSKVVYTCIGLEIGLGHFLFVVSWIDLYSCLKISKVVYPCIGLEIGLGHFLYVVSWIDNIFLPKNVQSGKSVYLIWNWIGFPLDDWIWWRWYDGEPTYWDLELGWLILLTFMIKNCQSGRSTYLIGNWIGLFLGSHLMSEQWYDGEPTYWDLELDWLISLFIFMMMHLF